METEKEIREVLGMSLEILYVMKRYFFMLGYKTEKFLFVALYTGRVLEMPMVTEDWLEQERQKMMKMIKTGDLPKNQSVLCGWCAYILDCEFGGTCLWV